MSRASDAYHEKRFLDGMVEMCRRKGVSSFTVTCRLLERAFFHPDPLMNLALAVGGHRPESSVDEQLDAFCKHHNLERVFDPSRMAMVFTLKGGGDGNEETQWGNGRDHARVVIADGLRTGERCASAESAFDDIREGESGGIDSGEGPAHPSDGIMIR